jgi:Protein of unknown function (DUF2442)
MNEKSELVVIVKNLAANGFSLLLDEQELHVEFEFFPWFKSATHVQINNVVRPTPDRLRWPLLDIDLAIDSIRYPDRFPLVSNVVKHR